MITFEITQTVEVSGDIATVEQKLRQDVAVAYDVKGVNEVLQTGELREYGALSLGRIQIDLNDGSTPVMETAVRNKCCCVFLFHWLLSATPCLHLSTVIEPHYQHCSHKLPDQET